MLNCENAALNRALRSKLWAAIALLLPFTVVADSSHRGDAHAPSNVMGDHTHAKGEWMFSYRYMDMSMEGNLDGTDSISTDEILMSGTGTYMVAATDMEMSMHMFGAMHAPTDRLTLMLMMNVIDLEMNHVTAAGGAFTTESSGIGDLMVGGLYSLSKTDNSNLILNFGLSIPTGSIDEEDVTGMSMGEEVQIPYPMQLGSGTYDLVPGITYTQMEDSWSYGAQAKATVRLGENDADYTLGNRYMATAWYARPLINHWSGSLRLAWESWDDIEGADSRLGGMAPMVIATADPELRAGSRLDIGLGINWIVPGTESTWRLSAEYLVPVQQDLDGPQLETDSTFSLTTQYSF